MNRMSKSKKLDIGLVPQALNNTNAAGKYYKMAMWRRALAKLSVGAMAAGTTAQVEFLQATSVAGANAKGIPDTAGQLAKALVNANTSVTEMTVTYGTPAVGDTITINGIVFTVAAATSAANRQFADANGLATCVNDPTQWVPGVTATNNAGTVTLAASDPGETTVTASKTGAALTLATTQAQAFVELDVAQLDTNNGFVYVAAKVTTTANTVVGVELIRDTGRFSPVQQVGASAVI